MRLVVLLLGALAAACDLEPDVGGAVAARCADDDGDPGTVTSFATDIQPIFLDRCRSCHFPDGAAPIGLRTTGLDLSSYATVIAGATVEAEVVVVAGKPCESILWQKVSPGPPFGGRMPLSGPPFLTDEQIQLIHDWIAEGALAN